jgi:hypothetical protein
MFIKPGASSYIAWIGWRPTNAHAQVGTHAVTVRATDPAGLSTTQTFSVAVANVNDRPVAVNDAYEMIKGGTLRKYTPGVLANDSDPDVGDTLTVGTWGLPQIGTLTRNFNGAIAYTPPADFTGIVKFTYRIKDNHNLASNLATVTISVRANRGPATVDDTVATTIDTPLVVDVLGNDSDPDSVIDPANRIDPATVFIPFGGKPSMGGAAIPNADGTIAYTPAPGFAGVETFMYAVKDTYSTPGISKAAYVRVDVY